MGKKIEVLGLIGFLMVFLLIFSSLVFAAGESVSLTATVTVLPPFITVYSPVEGETYNTTQIVLDVGLREQAKGLYYNINGGRDKRLCRACDKYYGALEAEEGENNLTLTAENYDKKYYYESVSFIVNTTPVSNDTVPPEILDTYPFKKGDGLFGVQYTEENLVGVTLYYGSGLENSYEFENCISGTEIWCYDSVDISQYNGQRIFYQFEVRDHYSSTLSKKVRIKVDTSTSIVSLGLSPYSSDAEKSFFDYIIDLFSLFTSLL